LPVRAGRPFGQVGAIVLGGLAGLALLRSGALTGHARFVVPVSRRPALVALTFFLVLLVGLPLLASLADSMARELFDSFYRAGALVRGG
jgi:chromate transporter